MEKWDVSLPPAKGLAWSAMADLILLNLPGDEKALMMGPFKLFPDPEPMLPDLPDYADEWRYQ
jgi:hypothetical protein